MIDSEMWWKGPTWLANPQEWPPNIVTQSSPESQGELKVQRELFAGAVEVRDDFYLILEKFGLSRAIYEDLCLGLAVHAQFSTPFEQNLGPLNDDRAITSGSLLDQESTKGRNERP